MALINKLPINLPPLVIVPLSIFIGVCVNQAAAAIGWTLAIIISVLVAGGVGYLTYRLLLKMQEE